MESVVCYSLAQRENLLIFSSKKKGGSMSVEQAVQNESNTGCTEERGDSPVQTEEGRRVELSVATGDPDWLVYS